MNSLLYMYWYEDGELKYYKGPHMDTEQQCKLVGRPVFHTYTTVKGSFSYWARVNNLEETTKVTLFNVFETLSAEIKALHLLIKD